jgi:hypothetical protein
MRACTLGRRTLSRVCACALLLRAAVAIAGGAQALKEAGFVPPSEFLWDADPRAASAAAGVQTASASPPPAAVTERRSPDAESGPPAASADSSGMAASAADPAREAAARPEVLDAQTPGSSGAPEARRSRSAYERTWRRQYVYVAATLPAEGKRCVANDLKRLQPDAVRASNLTPPNGGVREPCSACTDLWAPVCLQLRLFKLQEVMRSVLCRCGSAHRGCMRRCAPCAMHGGLWTRAPGAAPCRCGAGCGVWYCSRRWVWGSDAEMRFGR